ncbi:peptide/nickel transport system substrate-binding protein [Rhizobiales bacterium GAS113]|jgi:peptide/nickel transport system substrate-binding protein|nr:peptide/nickel transport system substrate-binding protein [Rhizobiales bacterium GAS113]
MLLRKKACRLALAALGAAAMLAGPAVIESAQAKALRFAFQGELKAVDPYAIMESFSLSMNGAVYEGLIRRGSDLKIEPCLATSWETLDPLHWRFHLRKGVKFHDGQDFTADDVVFSAQRLHTPGSDQKNVVPPDADVVKVDDYTVDFVLKHPDPLLISQWEIWGIFSKSWAQEHGATEATAMSATTPPYAALHANGTGPFILVSHEPGVKTVWKKNPNWWDTPKHNLDEVVFTPIPSNATRVAALLSGEIDWMDPVPLPDQARVNANPGTEVMAGPELRTIFLGFDQMRPELGHASVKGKNPFQDVRVRKAFYQAIDEEAIKTKVMRGLATPAALMIAPSLFSEAGEFKRLPFDPEASKKLLAEAGYPNGFEVQLDCPNDRYVNDEAICQAVVGMLARIGVKINLVAEPKSKYFARILAAGGFDTSFFLLGWTPGTFESYNVFQYDIQCRDEKGNGGGNNIGGYCNPKVDQLARDALQEQDQEKRDDIFRKAWQLALFDDVSYIPLHQAGAGLGRVEEGACAAAGG